MGKKHQLNMSSVGTLCILSVIVSQAFVGCGTISKTSSLDSLPAYEYACGTKEKEDGFVTGKEGQEVWTSYLKSNPQILTDVSKAVEMANEVRAKCRPEEVALVDDALKDCECVIPNGTEAERISSFKRLYEFSYRCLLRKAWRAAQEAAQETVRKRVYGF